LFVYHKEFLKLSTDDTLPLREKIKKFIRHSSQERIRLHSRHDDFNVVELNEAYTPGQILGNWMAMILVSGESIRITYKIHFDYNSVKNMAYPIYGKSSADLLSDQQAVDFMKELCNLTAGQLVKIFEDNDLSIGISLPLCTRGFYELFADYKETEHPVIKYSDTWNLQYGGGQLVGSAIVEILDVSGLNKLLSYEIPDELDDDDDDEELDFL
jgi:hypothetical protein